MYAVIDVETTGLRPEGNDRVIEVAVVQLDGDGKSQERWCTLVNPGRDLGAQDIHGIRAAELLDAPTFAQIAGQLAGLLKGRSVVAHNLSFDLRFLHAEFARLRVQVPLEPHLGMCTMRLAAQFLPYAGRTLAACCKAAGIALTNAHSALHDAQAAADLMGRYLRHTGTPPPWASVCAQAARAPWPDLPVRDIAPVLRQTEGVADEHFLRRLVTRLPRVYDADADAYLDLLDQCLLDRRVSATEAHALIEFAHSLGLVREQVESLHVRYLDALAAVAWQDRIVTDDERHDLEQVAAALDLDRHHVARALHRAEAEPEDLVDTGLGQFQLTTGDRVVFTGQFKLPRQVWEERAVEAGLVAAAAVTKKTRLLVAADPDTQSGKARLARSYGIPVVDTATFQRLCRQRSHGGG